MLPSDAKGTNIIKVDTSDVNVTYYLLHNMLGKARNTFEVHRELILFVLAKWHDNDTEFLNGFVNLKHIVLHEDVKFGEILYLDIWSDISVMIGRGYCLHIIALLSGMSNGFVEAAHPFECT